MNIMHGACGEYIHEVLLINNGVEHDIKNYLNQNVEVDNID